MSLNGDSDAILNLDRDFTESIRKELKKRWANVGEIRVTPGSGKGDNYLGIIARIRTQTIDENGKKIAINWIAKIAPEGEMVKKALDIDKLYEREVLVYETVFPVFDAFQDERAVLKAFDFYPNYVFHYLEKSSFVMEDMKSLGYKMKNRKEPLNYEHVKLVMEAYGKFHAVSFALRDQNPEQFQQLADSTPEVMLNKDFEDDDMMVKYLDMYHGKVAGALLPGEDEDAISAYEIYKKTCIDDLKHVMNASNEYSVIGHGDSWVNNMLFKYENHKHPNRPTRVCLLDWQLCRYGSPAFDLSYFIFTCTDKALRDVHYDNMIKLYYHSLCQHLVDLGSDPEKLFPYWALQKELKRASIYGLYMSVMVVQLMMSETDEIPDLQNMKEDDLIIDYKSVNDDLYKERIRGVVNDFTRFGYFNYKKA